MTLDVEQAHSDSLSAATISTRALSMPPSLRPPHLRRPSRLVATAVCAAALGGVVTIASRTHGAAHPDVVDAPRVQGRTVSFSSAFAARSGIRTMEVHEASFAPVIAVSGKASFDPAHVATVGAHALGTVRRVSKYEGETVSRGEVLAEIGSASQARMDAAASLGARQFPRGTLGLSLLRSPLDGVVVERRITMGQSVRGERVAFVIANLDHLSLELSLDPVQARPLRVGDHVDLSREAAPYGNASGVIVALDARGETELARVSVDNRARRFRPGQPLTARLFASRADALVVPNRAVVWIAGQPSVFVSETQNQVSANAITLGSCDGEQTEVRLGLASGQRIVTDGVPRLKEAAFF